MVKKSNKNSKSTYCIFKKISHGLKIALRGKKRQLNNLTILN